MPTGPAGFASPNHTQTPNDLFDLHMRDMEETELKVVLALTRQTLGYHRKHVRYSINKLMEVTGLSRNGVKKGCLAAEKRGLFERTNKEDQGAAEWNLVIQESNYDQGGSTSDQGGGSTSDQGGVTQCPTSTAVKKVIKEREEEEEGKRKKKAFSTVFAFFEENFGAARKFDYELMGDLVDEHTAPWVISAMKIAVKRGARNLAYTDQILKRWKVEGYGTEKNGGKGSKPKKIKIIRAPETEQPVIDPKKIKRIQAKT